MIKDAKSYVINLEGCERSVMPEVIPKELGKTTKYLTQVTLQRVEVWSASNGN
jgi:hypothetical protein